MTDEQTQLITELDTARAEMRTLIADLVPDPANPRAHPEGNLDAIVASLRRFGQAEPLVGPDLELARVNQLVDRRLEGLEILVGDAKLLGDISDDRGAIGIVTKMVENALAIPKGHHRSVARTARSTCGRIISFRNQPIRARL